MKHSKVEKTILSLTALFVLLLWINVFFASAEGTLPSSVTVIDREAFAGDINISTISLPEGLKEIRARAFADMALYSVTVPAGLTSIASDAFEGITTPLLITTARDSSAVRFALKNNLDFRADTVFRALLIGQSAYPKPNNLSGPAKDLVKMNNLLSDDYGVTVLENVSTGRILSGITETFKNAGDEDISLFYYSGHGMSSDDPDKNGALVGIDYSSYLTAGELREALDAVPGRKIVLIDACYSGALIGRDAKGSASSREGEKQEDAAKAQKQEGEIEDPAVSFIRSFTTPHNRKGSALQQYFVLTSSKSTEKSWEANYGGVFTNAFVESRTAGDLNNDGVTTFLECFTYTAERVSSTVAAGGFTQSVQVFPDDCYWFGIFR